MKIIFISIFIIFANITLSYSEDYDFKKLVKLNEPWGSSFINKDKIIITEKDGKIKVTGKWNDGRIGIFRESNGYGGTAKCENGVHPVGKYDGYAPLVKEIIRFFISGKSPVDDRETLEIYAFMDAADKSKSANGNEIPLNLDWE